MFSSFIDVTSGYLFIFVFLNYYGAGRVSYETWPRWPYPLQIGRVAHNQLFPVFTQYLALSCMAVQNWFKANDRRLIILSDAKNRKLIAIISNQQNVF